MMITIYGKPNCKFCTKAKNLVDGRMLKHEYKDVSLSANMDELKNLYPAAKTVPQIFISGKHIGGYSEFASYLENTGYNGTGSTL